MVTQPKFYKWWHNWSHGPTDTAWIEAYPDDMAELQISEQEKWGWSEHYRGISWVEELPPAAWFQAKIKRFQQDLAIATIQIHNYEKILNEIKGA